MQTQLDVAMLQSVVYIELKKRDKRRKIMYNSLLIA